MTEEDDEFVRIEKESLWRKRQIEEDLGQPVYFKPKKEWVDLELHEIAELQRRYPNPQIFGIALQEILKEKNHG
jgi:hypothetical protein